MVISNKLMPTRKGASQLTMHCHLRSPDVMSLPS